MENFRDIKRINELLTNTTKLEKLDGYHILTTKRMVDCKEHDILVQSVITEKEYKNDEVVEEKVLTSGYCVKCGLYLKEELDKKTHKKTIFDIKDMDRKESEESIRNHKYIQVDFKPDDMIKSKSKNKSSSGYSVNEHDYEQYFNEHQERRMFPVKKGIVRTPEETDYIRSILRGGLTYDTLANEKDRFTDMLSKTNKGYAHIILTQYEEDAAFEFSDAVSSRVIIKKGCCIVCGKLCELRYTKDTKGQNNYTLKVDGKMKNVGEPASKLLFVKPTQQEKYIKTEQKKNSEKTIYHMNDIHYKDYFDYIETLKIEKESVKEKAKRLAK